MYDIKISFILLSSIFVFVCTSGIYHEHTKITFTPDVKEKSDFFGFTVVLNKYGWVVCLWPVPIFNYAFACPTSR